MSLLTPNNERITLDTVFLRYHFFFVTLLVALTMSMRGLKYTSGIPVYCKEYVFPNLFYYFLVLKRILPKGCEVSDEIIVARMFANSRHITAVQHIIHTK